VVVCADTASDTMFPSINQSAAAATALGFHAPLPGLTPAASNTQASSSLSASVGVYNAAPSAASGLLTTVVSTDSFIRLKKCA